MSSARATPDGVDSGTDSGVPTGGAQRLRINDPAVMRALAHPARLAVLDHLSAGDTDATATEFAALTGLSPSAMSYHLRALAKLGLIEQAPGEADGRERRWRRAPHIRGGYTIESTDDASADELDAEQELLVAWLATEDAHLRSWLGRRQADPPDWRRATSIAGIRIQVTSQELDQLNESVFELLRPFQQRARAGDTPPGSRRISVQYRAIPVDEPPDRSS